MAMVRWCSELSRIAVRTLIGMSSQLAGIPRPEARTGYFLPCFFHFAKYSSSGAPELSRPQDFACDCSSIEPEQEKRRRLVRLYDFRRTAQTFGAAPPELRWPGSIVARSSMSSASMCSVGPRIVTRGPTYPAIGISSNYADIALVRLPALGEWPANWIKVLTVFPVKAYSTRVAADPPGATRSAATSRLIGTYRGSRNDSFGLDSQASFNTCSADAV